MSNSVLCRFIPYRGNSASSGNQIGGVVVLEINPTSGDVRRLTISKSHDLKLNFGDSIKCISGTTAVMINPGTPAGAFLLDPKNRPILEINAETTKIVHRGSITVESDIGTVLTKGTATTR